jgi:hypothetical protein
MEKMKIIMVSSDGAMGVFEVNACTIQMIPLHEQRPMDGIIVLMEMG